MCVLFIWFSRLTTMANCDLMLVGSRPPTRLDSRPSSRLDSRPSSRLDSRPSSRLESRPSSSASNVPLNNFTNRKAYPLKSRHGSASYEDELFGGRDDIDDATSPQDTPVYKQFTFQNARRPPSSPSLKGNRRTPGTWKNTKWDPLSDRSFIDNRIRDGDSSGDFPSSDVIPGAVTKTNTNSKKRANRNLHTPSYVDDILFGPPIESPSFPAPWEKPRDRRRPVYTFDCTDYKQKLSTEAKKRPLSGNPNTCSPSIHGFS